MDDSYDSNINILKDIKKIKGMFGWGDLESRIKMEMGDFHFNCLDRKSPIPILISGHNRNGSIPPKFNSNSFLRI